MFNFNSLTVINNNSYLGGERFLIANDPAGKKVFKIKGVNDFYDTDRATGAAGALKITRKAYSLPIVSTADINIDAITTAGYYELYLYLKLTTDSQNSLFANDLMYKGKPLIFGVTLTTADVATSTATATKLASAINNAYAIVEDYKHIVASVKTVVDDSTLVLTAKNEFIVFDKIELSKYVDADDEFTAVTAPATIVAPKSGFGTYYYMITNLKMPNADMVLLGGQNQDEAPVQGTNYDQYTIKYTQTRPALGGANATDEKVTSVTTHVVYVANTGAAATSAAKTPVPAGVSLAFENACKDVTTNYSSVSVF